MGRVSNHVQPSSVIGLYEYWVPFAYSPVANQQRSSKSIDMKMGAFQFFGATYLLAAASYTGIELFRLSSV